jgi:hypothetical protein
MIGKQYVVNFERDLDWETVARVHICERLWLGPPEM